MAEARTLWERTQEIARLRMYDAPETIRHALSHVEASITIQTVEKWLPVMLGETMPRRSILILAGPPRVGKTVAMYYAFALAEAIRVENIILREKERYREYVHETRPSILAAGPPEAPPPPDPEANQVLPHDGLYRLALRRYEHALQEPVEPDWRAKEESLVHDSCDTHVLRARDLIDRAWNNQNWLNDITRRGALLGIDDWGTEYMSDKGWHLSLWDDFIDYRHRHALPTIFTTNLSAEQLKERYTNPEHGARIAGRLAEVAHMHWHAKR